MWFFYRHKVEKELPQNVNNYLGGIGQWSSAFLAPGTGFVEDSFSHRRGGRRGECGSGGNVTNGERWGAADEASLAPLARALLTFCCIGPWTGGWGPLV